MRPPQPSDWFGGYSWLGFLNRFLLRFFWLRLFVTSDEAIPPRVTSIGLMACHPDAMYEDTVAVHTWRKIFFEVKL